MAVINFDKQKFDDLYQKYAAMIFRTSYNFLLNKEDAQDIVQEVFIKYFTSNKKFNDCNHEKAWILKVTANLSKNSLRSKSCQNLKLDDYIMNKKNFYIIVTSCLIVALIIFEIVMYYTVGKTEFLENEQIRKLWICFPTIIISLSLVRDYVIKKVYTNDNKKK